MNEEVWKDIPGYEFMYQASNLGRVRSVDRYVVSNGCSQKLMVGQIKRLSVHCNGYLYTRLWKENKSKNYFAHVLVMMAFQPVDMSRKLDVNHKDGDKTNNNLNNLEWLTRGENHSHRYRVLGQKHSMTGRCGSRHPKSIPVVATPVGGGEARVYVSMKDAVRDGFLHASVSMCVHGKIKTHKGHVFTFAPA